MADWFKARQFDKLVDSVNRSPLRKLFLGDGSSFVKPSVELALRLCELLRPEVEELENILNRDFSAWKSLEDGQC